MLDFELDVLLFFFYMIMFGSNDVVDSQTLFGPCEKHQPCLQLDTSIHTIPCQILGELNFLKWAVGIILKGRHIPKSIFPIFKL